MNLNLKELELDEIRFNEKLIDKQNKMNKILVH